MLEELRQHLTEADGHMSDQYKRVATLEKLVERLNSSVRASIHSLEEHNSSSSDDLGLDFLLCVRWFPTDTTAYHKVTTLRMSGIRQQAQIHGNNNTGRIFQLPSA
jgi:hypothetical protein